jgi:segregation and condensation protein A
MQIKVRMLLPKAAEGEEEEDPRADLVRRLLEYKRFKEASALLSTLEDESRKLHYRQAFAMDPKQVTLEDQEESLRSITMFNLISAFKRVLDNAPRKVYHDVEMLNVSIDEQMGYIADVFRLRSTVTFFELVSHMQEKIRIVVTIIAMLEMVKNRMIGLRQADHEDDFIIYKLEPEAA